MDNIRSKLNFNDITCYCVPGYTGTYCQIDINECLSQPCSNNSTCVDGINRYECRCPAGYTGHACEIDINECDSSPCSSPGGTCVDLVDGYYCQCSPGYTGPSCAIDIDECHSQPCQHNSTCVDLVNGFECNCTDTGYEGALCERNIDDCARVKCEHGSVCVDGVKSYKCECHTGYDGRLCEIDLNECESGPCMYGGICWQNSDPSSYLRREQVNSSASSFEFDYTRAAGYWCECEPGYTGANCEIKINECESSPCGLNGECIDLVNGYRCVCFNGYTGVTCMDNIDECAVYSPCAPESKCTDLKPDYSRLNRSNSSYLDGYSCDCTSLNEDLFKSSGTRDVLYAGLNCTTKLNACVTLKHMCMHKSECKSVLNTTTAEQDIECLCKPGYTGKYCQYATTFRMDATYSITHEIPQNLHLVFDFRLNFFNRTRMPLLYLKDEANSLVVAVEVNRMSLRVSNPSLSIDEHLGFYYSTSQDLFEQTTWSTLEIELLSPDTLKFVYSIKQFHLKVTKLVNVTSRGAAAAAAAAARWFVVMGKAYAMDAMADVDVIRAGVYSSEAYFLNSACLRDVRLNGEQLFKSESPDYVNSGLGDAGKSLVGGVKFGCNLNQETAANQCNTELVTMNKNVCENNSTCVNKWFDYECVNCSWPFFGKTCQYGQYI